MVRVQEEPFEVGAELAAFARGRTDAGGIASFVGLVRDEHDGEAITAMTLEHYPGMTEKSLEAIIAEAGGRWQLQGVRVIHRFGRLLPGEYIVYVFLPVTGVKQSQVVQKALDTLQVRLVPDIGYDPAVHALIGDGIR